VVQENITQEIFLAEEAVILPRYHQLKPLLLLNIVTMEAAVAVMVAIMATHLEMMAEGAVL
jgi:hypothetical protein